MKIIPIFLLVICTTAAATQPNIIFLLTDDRGIETCVPDGNTNGWTTPEMDSISTNGMSFANMQATMSCAPSRATCLTGRYSGLRLDPAITYPPLGNGAMSTNEVTFADQLKAVGYNTAKAGKWNLRFGDEADTSSNITAQAQHLLDCGFDTNFTFVGHTIQYWGDTNVVWGTGDGYATGGEDNYMPFLINQWATNYIVEQAASGEPFFLDYSFGLVHFGTQYNYEVTPDNLGSAGLDGDDPANFPVLVDGMIAYHDKMVGNVLDMLDALGIASNTIVIYAADNGTDADLTNSYNGVEVVGGKLTHNATGSRVPFYVSWPGTITPGSTFDGLASFDDIFNLIVKLGGGSIPTDRVIDGKSGIYDAVLNGGGAYKYSAYLSNRSTGVANAPVYFEKDWRLRRDSASTELFKVNWPLLDIETDPASSQIASNAYLRLSIGYNNETNRTYGVGVNGLTQEVIFQTTP